MGSEERGKTVSESQIAGLRELFQRFDRDSDGSLTVSELGALLRSLGLKPSGEQLASLLANVDANGNGLIEFVELMSVIAPDVAKNVEICNNLENLLELFRAFDKDDNGYITAVELAHYMAKLGHALSLRELTQLIRKADSDSDGKINFSEFAAAATSEFADLLKLFRAFDKDGNGYVTAVELVHSMAKRGHALSIWELKELITKADTDSDGKISFAEFTAAVQSEFSDLLELFRAFDKDTNGYITAVELVHFMAKRGCALSLRELTEIITKADTDSDGKISLSEFADTVTSESADLLEFCHAFDKNDNGYLTVVELAHSTAKLLGPHSR